VNYLTTGALGEAFTEARFGSTNASALVDTAVGWVVKDPLTIPHEIGHLLTNWRGHYEDNFPNDGAERKVPNMMHDGTSETDTVEATKRLWLNQQDDI
jgi:hypothetical protein